MKLNNLLFAARLKEHKADINKLKESLSVISTHRLEGHEFKWDTF